ncbi:hypothetical protein [uncultured Nitrosomonas sp.]|nr:hypothetical protein [uncultured Nitrosomonas sp.]
MSTLTPRLTTYGHIIERGTHQQLLAMSDKYACMWELQRQQEID